MELHGQIKHMLLMKHIKQQNVQTLVYAIVQLVYASVLTDLQEVLVKEVFVLTIVLDTVVV